MILFPPEMMEGGHFFPNLEALAGDDGGGGRGRSWLEMISFPEMTKAWLIVIPWFFF